LKEISEKKERQSEEIEQDWRGEKYMEMMMR